MFEQVSPVPETQNQYDVHIVEGKPAIFSGQMHLVASALRMGAEVRRTSKSKFFATSPNGERLLFIDSRTALTKLKALRICKDKSQTKGYLAEAGIAAARGQAVFSRDNIREALGLAEYIGFPVVTKPVAGSQGKGVTAPVSDKVQFERAFYYAAEHGDVMVEKYKHGKDIRIFATRHRAIAATLRRPASVLGDGISSLTDLISEKNKKRRKNPYLRGKPIRAESNVMGAGAGMDKVPPLGERIFLNSVANISRGGDSIDVTDIIHPYYLNMAVRAVRAIPELEYGGVDLLVSNFENFDREGAIVVEVNATPEILMQAFPAFGHARDVGRAIVSEYMSGLTEVPEPFATQIEIAGAPVQPTYIDWLRAKASLLGLEVLSWTVEEAVHATMRGPVERVAMLMSRCFDGPAEDGPLEVVGRPK